MIFSHVLLFNGVKITKIEVNEDDSHGKPDTIIVADNIEKGIQLTKISLNDPLKRINISAPCSVIRFVQYVGLCSLPEA